MRSVIMSSSLPDGAHQTDKDLIYFHLPSWIEHRTTLFALSSYRQIDTKVSSFFLPSKREKEMIDLFLESVESSIGYHEKFHSEECLSHFAKSSVNEID